MAKPHTHRQWVSWAPLALAVHISHDQLLVELLGCEQQSMAVGWWILNNDKITVDDGYIMMVNIDG